MQAQAPCARRFARHTDESSLGLDSDKSWLADEDSANQLEKR